MSIECTEAYILAEQMNKEITGKTVKGFEVQNSEQLQQKGFISKNMIFQQLVGGKILAVTARGNTILLKLSNGWNLILAPEYGGIIQLYAPQTELPKFHLKLDLENAVLTVTLTGMGCIQAVEDALLKTNYMYNRDFGQILNPLDADFTFEQFVERLDEKKQNIKAALVGKTAVIVGISNSAFQDIIYRAKIGPKRNTGTLTGEEKRALYTAIVGLVKSRLDAGGKEQFVDLHGKQGAYVSKMGPNLKEQNCPACGSRIEKISHGGGQVYLCPACQK